jgi:hypothetical protein
MRRLVKWSMWQLGSILRRRRSTFASSRRRVHQSHRLLGRVDAIRAAFSSASNRL